MSSKDWVDKAIRKPGTAEAEAQRAGEDDAGKTGKRARLAEMLLKMWKENG